MGNWKTYTVIYYGILGRSEMEVKAPTNTIARQMAKGELNSQCQIESVKLKR